MAYHMVGLVDDSNRSTAALKQREHRIDVLEAQNSKLKQIISELKMDKEKLQLDLNSKKSQKELSPKRKREPETSKVQIIETQSFVKPSALFERTRRRTENEIKELWYFISAEVTKINKKNKDPWLTKKLTQTLQDVQEMHNAITINMAKLNSLDGRKEWFLKESKELSALVQKRIHYLQNPKDCKSAKKLVCQINKGCGYDLISNRILKRTCDIISPYIVY